MTRILKGENIRENERVNLSKLMPADEYSKRILSERTKTLSVSETAEHESQALMTDYIKFLIGENEYYGIPYKDIQDIKMVEFITQVPMSPQYVVGITYWHGKIIPVIDLGQYFNVVDVVEKKKHVVVATIMFDKLMVGLAFTGVVGVDSYLGETLDENIPTSQAIKEKYILGIHSGRITILNAKEILLSISSELMNKKGE